MLKSWKLSPMINFLLKVNWCLSDIGGRDVRCGEPDGVAVAGMPPRQLLPLDWPSCGAILEHLTSYFNLSGYATVEDSDISVL